MGRPVSLTPLAREAVIVITVIMSCIPSFLTPPFMKALLLILLISLSSCKANWFYDVGASRHLPTSD